ncbi:MAG: ATP-binding cassette domain-containing protein [Rhodospirillales bacterium]|nr:ATP-binding cassette domain-containing protein [Rhodospirillales bacterium]
MMRTSQPSPSDAPAADNGEMEPTLFKFIFRYSWRQQVWLLTLTAFSFPTLYLSLELPKLIINKAIGSQDFPKTYWGVELGQIQYLAALSFVFLGLVVINGSFKYYINVYKGQVSERMLRRLRYQMFTRILRFPIPHFRRASQGELIAMITAEVEPVGGFVGDSLAVPAFEGRTLVTSIAFMLVQDPILGAAALALYPLQMYLIPKLQRQVNALSKQRVRTVRKLSERIGEVVTGVEEVHANGTAEWERADISRWLGVIYWLRYDIYRKKFFIKFLNTFLGQLTPFFFYLFGGYLVINGELTIGALVAVLAAYKDMSDPWKELLSWYQQKEDTRVKYDQIVEQFDPAGMLAANLQDPPQGDIPHLSGPVVCSNLILEEEGGIKTLDGVSFQFDLGERVALVGTAGSGADIVAKLVARLVAPTGGSIRFGESSLATLSQAVTGQRIGYVGQSVALFSGNIRDNLLYGLKHRPLESAPVDDEEKAEQDKYITEALAAGNTASDVAAVWIDIGALNISGPSALSENVAAALATVDMERDVLGLGLQGAVSESDCPNLAQRVLEARAELRSKLAEPEYEGLVVPFDRDVYNGQMSVAENILFGTPVGPTFSLAHIAENDYMLSVLDTVGIREQFLDVGIRTARIMTEVFQELSSGHDFFARFSFISADDLPAYEAALRRVDSLETKALSEDDRSLFMALPFKLITERHRLGLLDAEAQAKLLEARRAFADGLPEAYRDAVAFFVADQYNPPASVLDNILFGKPDLDRPRAHERLTALVLDVVDSLGLRPTLIDVGLDFEIGIGGGRLSIAQRQKLAIARAVLKCPDLMIIDQATAVLDPAGRAAMREALLTACNGRGLLWVLPEIGDAAGFDRVIMMENGRVVAQAMPDAVLEGSVMSSPAGS